MTSEELITSSMAVGSPSASAGQHIPRGAGGIVGQKYRPPPLIAQIGNCLFDRRQQGLTKVAGAIQVKDIGCKKSIGPL